MSFVKPEHTSYAYDATKGPGPAGMIVIKLVCYVILSVKAETMNRVELVARPFPLFPVRTLPLTPPDSGDVTMFQS